jgi:pimeloyl-ACP methyl ester carboxylesterase
MVHYYDWLGLGQSEQRDGQRVSPVAWNALLAKLLAHWKLHGPDVIVRDPGRTLSARCRTPIV